jgi:hypothetical protein
VALTGALALTFDAHATTSGLNNIPTADTASHLTLVFQEYSFYKPGQPASHWAGFKFGIDPWHDQQRRSRFEVGLDGYLGTNDAGPAVLQAKWTVDTGKGLPSISVGTANVAATAAARQTAGQPFSYLVVTQDFKVARLHGGYGLQGRGNNAGFVGIDRTMRVAKRDLMLRADAIQTDHRDNWETSAGFLYGVHRHFALESWVSEPVHGGHAGFMVKFDVILP